MTVTYCTAANVASHLRLKDSSTGARLAFGTTTDPTQTEVESWINEAEEFIDSQTNHSWKETTVANEYHRYFGEYDGMFGDIFRKRIIIPLNHRVIRTFDTEKGDKVELWTPNGGYEDLLAADSGYEYGDDKDWSADLTNGQLIFLRTRPYASDHAVRVTYRYGEATVPYDIREACIKKVAIRYLESEIYTATVPNGPSLSPSKDSIIDRWQEDIDRIISRRKEYPMINY